MSPHETIEERLQHELTEVADSTRLSPDAWAEVERRAQPRRLLRVFVAVAAALAVGAIATATVLLVGRGDDGDVEVAADGDRAAQCGVTPPADLEVTLAGATAPQIEAVEQLLADAPAVADYSFQSQEDGARLFECVFADEPETLADADLSRIPARFQVTLEEEPGDLTALFRDLEALTGVTASRGNCSERADLEVFLLVNATPEQTAAARAAIEQTPGVEGLRFVTKEETYEEFVECLFSHQPDLVEATTPDALPPSFRVTLSPGADPRTIRKQFARLDGVDTVVDTRYAVVPPVPSEATSGDADELPPP